MKTSVCYSAYRLRRIAAIFVGFAASVTTVAQSDSPGDIKGVEPVVTRPIAFFDVRSPNVGGIFPGEGVVIGALSVVPSGDSDGDGLADSDGVSLPTTAVGDFDCVTGRKVSAYPIPGFENAFSRFVSATGRPCKLRGPWKLTFANGGKSTTVWTRAIDDSVRVPLVLTLWLSHEGATPEFNWVVPPDSPHNSVMFRLFDLENRIGGRVARIIYSKKLPAYQSSIVLPAGEIRAAHRYAAAVELRVVRDREIATRSRSMFSFDVATEPVGVGQMLLPIVDGDGGAPGIALGKYTAEVEDSRFVWFQVPAAENLIYVSEPGSPPVQSLALPASASRVLMVHHANRNGATAGTLLSPGEEIAFPQGAVGEFSLSWLDAPPAPDSGEILSFPLGLRLASSGRLTATLSGRLVPAAWTVPCRRRLLSKVPGDGTIDSAGELLPTPAVTQAEALACGVDVTG